MQWRPKPCRSCQRPNHYTTGIIGVSGSAATERGGAPSCTVVAMRTNYIQLLFLTAFRTVRINLGQENGATNQTVLVVILVVLG